MSGKVIGLSLDYGYAGSVSRSADLVAAAYCARGGPIYFGAPVVLNDDGTVSAVSEECAAPVIGLAMRRVMQPKANYENGWFFQDGDALDVMLRGAMTVEVRPGSSMKPLQKAYVEKSTGLLLADPEDAESSDDVAEFPNAVFPTGLQDGNGMVELLITTRSA